jgi:NAD(P)-dependent dehydrogenase (short-subunit alcohol dehydrogenase family)
MTRTPIRSQLLYGALRNFCLGSFFALAEELEAGAELPVALAEHGGVNRPTLYEYRPLVGAFVEQRAGWLGRREDALEALGGLDCLVNNAGIAGPTGRVEEINPEDWDRCLAVDLTGQFNCARLAIPHLRQSKNASMMNVSSQAGEHGFPLRSPYAAAKWGVIGFTKTLSMELGPYGIRVNALLPGIVAGDRIRRVLEAKAQQRGVSYDEQERFMFQFTSIKEYVTPQQLADMVVFTASPRARTISGQAISVCGDTNMLG